MQESALSTIGLPVALAIIMLGLGLHLKLDDFKRIWTQPRAMLIGLACQVLLLPPCALAWSRPSPCRPNWRWG